MAGDGRLSGTVAREDDPEKRRSLTPHEILAATADPAKHSRITGSAPAGTTLKLSKRFENQTTPVVDTITCGAAATPGPL